MRLTFTDLINRCIDGSGGDNATASQTFYKQRINSRYEKVISALLKSPVSETTKTFSTVADQQYYHRPSDMRSILDLTITIGSVLYPLEPVESYQEWKRLNAIQIQAGAIPDKYFLRNDDYGIWPIPQSAYTGTIVYTLRAHPMTASDYTTGTVTVTENSQTVTGSGTSWSSNAKVGYWFSLADSNGEPRGSWYKISGVGSDTSITLQTSFEESTEAGASYIIGESPSIPEEMHELLSDGALADYFAEKRQDINKSTWFENRFHTGDGNNQSRDPRSVNGGFIKYVRDYQKRSQRNTVRRRYPKQSARDKVWATTIS